MDKKTKKSGGRKRNNENKDKFRDKSPLPIKRSRRQGQSGGDMDDGRGLERGNGGRRFDRQEDSDMSAAGSSMDGAAKNRRFRRPRWAVKYNMDGPAEDEFIFCERCQEPKYNGCEIHPVIFDYDHKFEVGPSKVSKKAGRGIFNNDIREVPEGVMFGPYSGQFYNIEEYKELKKTRGESGYAWEILDPDKIKVIGFIDPGPDPDPKAQWMSHHCQALDLPSLWPDVQDQRKSQRTHPYQPQGEDV